MVLPFPLEMYGDSSSKPCLYNLLFFYFLFFDNRGCPSQLKRTSTNSTGPWSEQPGKYPSAPKGTQTYSL